MVNWSGLNGEEPIKLRRARRALTIASVAFPIVLVVGYWLAKVSNSGLPFLLPGAGLFAIVAFLSIKYFYLYWRHIHSDK